MALLMLFFLDILITIPGAWIAAGRMLWTLGRDNATPFPSFIGKVSPRFRTPFNAQLIVVIAGTILGGIYVASATAFNAFVATFTIMTTMSYAAAILPHMLTKRRYVRPGPFWMPDSIAYIVMSVACIYILLFNILYMFPYTYPVESADLMNWTSVIFVGITVLLALGYFLRTRGIGGEYVGPHVVLEASGDDVMRGAIGLDKEVEKTMRRS